MTKNISHILFSISIMAFVFSISAQDKNPFGTNLAMPLKLNPVKGKLNQFGSSDQDHVTSLQLFDDSSFVYFNRWLDKFDFTLGQYSRHGNLLLLNWDSLKTYKATTDTSIYKKYFKYGVAQPLKVINTKYYINTTSHSIKQPVPTSQINEYFITSKDLLNDNGILMDSLKSHNRPTPSFDTIWGYRTWFPNGGHNLLRLHPNFNYSGNRYQYQKTFSSYILQVDKIIIYFARGGYKDYAFFSKDLDSEIMFLNKENLAKCYADNKYFLELIDKEPNLRSFKITGGQHKYKVVDLYKKSIGVK